MGEVKAITPGFGALPEVVYFDNPKLPGRPRRFDTDAPIAAVRRGESGFYPVYSHSTAEDLNEAEEVTAAQAEAMLQGSMFGWDVPAANPDYWADRVEDEHRGVRP